MFGPLQSHGLQHTRLPCLSLSPRVCSNSCPSWVVMPSNHLILCRPLLLLPLVFLSIRVFSNESALDIKWPKYQSFNISISPSNGYSGLISFRIYWFDLLSVQGTIKSLLYFFLFYYFILFLEFTILYWFCHISTWIRHRHTWVPHPEPSP